MNLATYHPPNIHIHALGMRRLGMECSRMWSALSRGWSKLALGGGTRMQRTVEMGFSFWVGRAWSGNPDDSTKAGVTLPGPWCPAATGDIEKLDSNFFSHRKCIHAQGVAWMKWINVLRVSRFWTLVAPSFVRDAGRESVMAEDPII